MFLSNSDEYTPKMFPDTINISPKFKFPKAISNIAFVLNDSFENPFLVSYNLI